MIFDEINNNDNNNATRGACCNKLVQVTDLQASCYKGRVHVRISD